MDYEKKYKDALIWMASLYDGLHGKTKEEAERFFPELKENRDERIRIGLIKLVNASYNQLYPYTPTKEEYVEMIDWLERQGEQVNCPKDLQVPNGGIVLEDFSNGEGFYKLHLDYLNKEQVKEVEALVLKWNLTDEDIKNCIGLCLTDVDEQRFRDFNTNLRDCLAWLEKQEKFDDEENAKLFLLSKGYPISANGDIPTYKEIFEIIKDGIEYQQKQCEKPQGKTALEAIKEEKVDNANKVEPKFKIGDWITDGHCKCQITFIGSRYWYSETCVLGDITSIDKTFHLWTVQDAKPGDVLVNGSNIFIFHFLNDTRLMGYCHINTDDGKFYDDLGRNECFGLIDGVFTPATKEQRDLLFSKMKEAGYRWDAEKKELTLSLERDGDLSLK